LLVTSEASLPVDLFILIDNLSPQFEAEDKRPNNWLRLEGLENTSKFK